MTGPSPTSPCVWLTQVRGLFYSIHRDRQWARATWIFGRDLTPLPILVHCPKNHERPPWSVLARQLHHGQKVFAMMSAKLNMLPLSSQIQAPRTAHDTTFIDSLLTILLGRPHDN